MKDSAKIFIEELNTIHDLYDYKNLISSIVMEIFSQGIKLSLRTDGGPNVYTYNNEDGHRIRISVGRSRKIATTVIWDLLHEYGHYLSGPKKPDQSIEFREMLAWDIAADKLNCFEIPDELRNEFYKFKNHCVNGTSPNKQP